jgi:multicomponent Na+:H+ antiporter subunit F
MTLFGQIALGILAVSALVTVARAVRHGSLGDRAIAFDMLTAVIACGLFVGAALSGEGLLLDLAVVIGLLGFLAAVTVARFIERRGS